MPPLCVPDTEACNNERNAKFGPRLDSIRAREREYDRRAWGYAAGVALALGAAAALAAGRHPSRARLRRLFADVGVSGVVLGLLGAGILLVPRGDRAFSQPTGPVFFPAVALLVLAGVGGVTVRLTSQGAESSDAAEAGTPSPATS